MTILFIVAGLLFILTTVCFIPMLRRALIVKPIMKLAGRAVPTISKTEETAMKAGTVWWDGELFSGTPDWQKLSNFKVQELNEEEQHFLDGPTEELCAMLNDWQISQARNLTPETWQFIKKNRFFGMGIPKTYGGLGFSAAAHSAVITKIASRSVTAAVIIMVPNSLGPGELLHQYGTQEQKDYYLPRLVHGEEIPCFALTEAKAGSDAAGGLSYGIVCEGLWQGKKILGMRLTFQKRYITLAPIATIIGLSFRLLDPDHLLGDVEDIGITCALIPRDILGLRIGDRHDPMGVPFPNGPVEGENVFLPFDYIIGGRQKAGKGWRMLMECLATGRGISLPSLSVGAAELSLRATTAYATIREQFGISIGHFEGIRERLARIAGYAYCMNAARRLTCGAVDAGESPSVISAMVKAYLTEGMRIILNDAMDIWAGTAISKGPANLFSNLFLAIPIGITVEGANILTRSLIVFGQGVLRCHPYLLKEIEALHKSDVAQFDQNFLAHLSHFFRTAARAAGYATLGRLVNRPPVDGALRGYCHSLNRLSTQFAFLVEIGIAAMRGTIKKKEYLSGRYADALAWMYIASATLNAFWDSDDQDIEKPLLDWAVGHAAYEAENALIGIVDNLPSRGMALLAKSICFPFGARHKKPSDRQLDAVNTAILGQPGKLREHITSDIFIPTGPEKGLAALEAALTSVSAAQPARKKLDAARREKRIAKEALPQMAQKALVSGIISKEEYELLIEAEEAGNAVIQVSAFSEETYFGLR